MSKLKNKFTKGAIVEFTEFDFNPRHDHGVLTFIGKVVEYIFDPGLDLYEYRIDVSTDRGVRHFWKAEKDLFPSKKSQ